MGFVRIAKRLVHVGAVRVHVVRRSAHAMIHVALHARPAVRRPVAVLHSAKTHKIDTLIRANTIHQLLNVMLINLRRWRRKSCVLKS